MAGPLSWVVSKLNPAQPHLHAKEPTISSENTMDYRTAYDQIEVVHRAIEMIVSACVDVPFEVDGVGPNKKLSKLLNERPNPFEDKIKLYRRAYLDLLLDGNAFFYYDGTNIYVLPAADVEIVSDPRTFVKGYNYKPSGYYSWESKKDKDTIFYKNDEVIHVKLDNDASIFRGKSPIKSLESIINIYNALLKFQKQFFKNNAVPGIVLTTDSVLNTKVKDRILQHWRVSYSTMFDGARNPAILDGGLKVDSFSNINFQSLDFENSVERLEQDMAKALGVPYVLMKSGNNANIAANQVLFYDHTILPLVSMVASAFMHYFNTSTIIPNRRGIRALQPDLKIQSQSYVSLVNAGIITPDEAREILGFEKLNIDETNSIRVPANIAGSAVHPDIGGRPDGGDNGDNNPPTN